MPAQYQSLSARVLLCRRTQTSKLTAGKSFCVNVIVLFTQCDKTVTVRRRIGVSASAAQGDAQFDFKRLVKQPRRDGSIDDFAQRKGGFDARDPWQSGNFLPVNELIILNRCGAHNEQIIIPAAHKVAPDG